MSSDQSAHLALPYLAAAQAQKHVTHNEALRRLDVFVQLTLESLTAPEPPAEPAEGACWFVPAGATGAFAGQDGRLASWEAGAFDFLAVPGDALAYVRDEDRFARYDGANWVSPLADRMQELSALSALVLESVATAAAPLDPTEGARWFVPAGASDAFAGHSGHLALAGAEDFTFLACPEGALAYIRDEDRLARYDGSAWLSLTAEPAAASLTGQLVLESVTSTAPPTEPMAGANWFVPAGATGAFAGQEGLVGTSGEGGFTFQALPTGTLAFIRDQWRLALYDGGAWVSPLAVRPTRSAIEAQVIEEDLILFGDTVETHGVIPARAIVLGVSTRTLSPVTGATSYDCGVAGELSKFGGMLGVAVGAGNSGVVGPTAFYTDTAVRLTANGGGFTGGRVRVSIHVLTCPVAEISAGEAAWWQDAPALLDATAPQLAADFVAERYVLAGVEVAAADVLVRTGGAKTVILASGAAAQVPANALAFDHSSGRRRLLLEGQATNLFIGNAAPAAAQAITVTAQAYTLSFMGTGTITLSGAASGTVSVAPGAIYAKHTFTPSAGSLTLTPAGDVRLVQLEVGSIRTSTIMTTSAAVTRATDVCVWSSAAAALITSSTPYTFALRMEIKAGFTGRSILRISGSSATASFLRSGNAGSLQIYTPVGVSGASVTADAFLPADFAVCAGFNSSGRLVWVNGASTNTSSSAPSGTITGLHFGEDAGVTAGERYEIDEMLIWPIKGSSGAIQAQSHVYAG